MNSASKHAPSREEVIGMVCEALEPAKGSGGPLRIESLCRDYPAMVAEIRHVAALMGVVAAAADPLEDERVKGVPVPPSLPGFTELKEIGVGGMGLVYKARQIDLGRDVALKLRLEQVSEADLKRFLREQRVLAKLHHTHIVPVHLAGKCGEHQYFVMALIEGLTLKDVISTLRDPASKHGESTTLAHLAEETVKSGYAGKSRSREKSGVSEPAVSPRPAGRTLALSPDYYRSVASVMADAAEAIQHAHDAEILHRDVKPSNIMVDRRGQCSIIDFGLASTKDDPGEAEVVEAVGPSEGGLTRGPLGTPSYMAPEQHDGKPGKQSDVWGLGATLYELLTLEQAFPGETVQEVRAAVDAGLQATPRALAPGVPADLDAICRKALRGGLAERYATPGEMGDDLRCWLRGEVTMARPRTALVRAWLWARRNPAWATALGAVVAAALMLGGVILQGFRVTAAEALLGAAQTEIKLGKTIEEAAKQREKDLLHEKEMVALQGRRLLTRVEVGWFDRLWPHVQKAAALRTDVELRNQAIATIQGLDAVRRIELPKAVGLSLAFDGKGRLLLGGDDRVGARVWDGSLDEPLTAKQAGIGPAAFRPDGTPVQLTINKDYYSYLLWDVQQQKALHTFKILDKDAKPPDASLLPRMVLSADGARAAVAAKLRDGKGVIAIWDTDTGKLLHRMAEGADSLAFSPRGEEGAQFLAAGHTDGSVSIWSLATGEKTARFSVGQAAVHALAFGESPKRGDGKTERRGLSRLRLAVGQTGGNISIWDLTPPSLLTHCLGSAHDIYSLAFSPDGMTLGSAGRNQPRLWDVATGRLLLELLGHGSTHAIAFSADGKRVATTGSELFGGRTATDVWELVPGRGVQSLRGLNGQAEPFAWSRDGRLLAALTQNWQLAVWDREANRLLHIFEPPPGLFAGNAEIAFSPDGKRLAYAGHKVALVWDIATGKQVHSREMGIGLVDRLIYAGDDRLYSFRMETANPDVGPMAPAHPQKHPRICKIRNLFAKEEKPHEIKEFNWHVFGTTSCPTANCFVADGTLLEGKKLLRSVHAFDAVTGKRIWSQATAFTKEGTYLGADPRGELVNVKLDDGDGATILDAASGRVREQRTHLPGPLGPQMRFWFQGEERLFSRAGDGYLFRVGIDERGPGVKAFNWAGTHFAWMNPQGVVNVCDLKAVRDRLAAEGLQW